MKGDMLRPLFFAGLLFFSLAGNGAVGKLVTGDMVVEKGTEWIASLQAPLASVEVRARLVEVQGPSWEVCPASWSLTMKDSAGMPVVRLGLTSPEEGMMDDMLPADPEVSVSMYDREGNIIRNELLMPPHGMRELDGGSYVTLSLSIDAKGMAEVMAGDERLVTMGNFLLGRDILSVVLGGDRAVDLWSVNIRERASDIGRMSGHAEVPSGLCGRLFSSSDQRVGIYEYLDSDIDTGMCRLGGRYRLGVLPDGAGGYEIVYLGGAETNGGAWRSGMVKGRLTPTVFRDHFNLEWIDAEMSDDMEDLWCQFDGVLMELHFPQERGVIRFSRSLPGR